MTTRPARRVEPSAAPRQSTPALEAAAEVLADVRIRLAQEDAAAAVAQQKQHRRKTPA